MTEKTESKEIGGRICFRIYFRICLSEHKYNYLFIINFVGYSLKLYDMLLVYFRQNESMI